MYLWLNRTQGRGKKTVAETDGYVSCAIPYYFYCVQSSPTYMLYFIFSP